MGNERLLLGNERLLFGFFGFSFFVAGGFSDSVGRGAPVKLRGCSLFTCWSCTRPCESFMAKDGCPCISFGFRNRALLNGGGDLNGGYVFSLCDKRMTRR